jgi:hypothetical protein
MVNILLHVIIRKKLEAWCQWFTPIILATWEAEIGRTEVPGQPRQIFPETSSPKLLEQNGLEV